MRNAERFDQLLREQATAADLKSHTIRGGAFAMAAEGVGFLLRLASIITLARLLVPEDFGLIAMVTAITVVAERFKDLGLAVATIQRKEITHDQVSTLFWINATTGLGVALFIVALAVPISHFYSESRLVEICLAIASTFIFSGITIQHQALLRRMMRFGQLAIIQVVSIATSVVIAVVLAILDFGYWALVAREVSAVLLVTMGTWICVPWIPGLPSRKAGVSALLRFGLDITAFNIMSFVTFSLDQILIGKFFGATPLGLYRQGINLVLAPINQLSYPVNAVAEAALSRLQGEVDRYRHYYLQILGAFAAVTMPLALFLATYAEEIVLVALGAKWSAAVDYFRILAIAVVVRPAASTAGFVMVTSGKSRDFLRWGLFQSATLAAFLFLGTQWGPKGVAYAHVAWSYSMLVPLLYWGFNGTPITVRNFVTTVKTPILAGIAMTLLLQVVKHTTSIDSPLHSLLLGSAIALPAYLSGWLLLPGGRDALTQYAKYISSFVRDILARHGGRP